MVLKTKYLIKGYCKYVYYAGLGNYWSEDIYHETIPYKLYSVISFGIYTTMVFLENLAALFGTFPDVEKNSAVMFAAIHNIVLPKMYLLLYHKESIRKLNSEMGTVGEKLEMDGNLLKQYRKVKWGNLFYVVTVYLSLIAYGVESTRRAVVEGRPFYTVVTYLPTYEDPSQVAAGVRIFFYCTWLYMMLPMMSADCMPITHLITMTHKFITLCQHYERIREDFETNINVMTKAEAVEKLKAGCLEGILMHQKLMLGVVESINTADRGNFTGAVSMQYLFLKWQKSRSTVWAEPLCVTVSSHDTVEEPYWRSGRPKSLADEINRVFGIIMSLQVCESSAVAVLLLLRLALSPHMDLTNAFMTYTFVGSLFYLLALNLWNAGEITYQASLLSDAMFYCGWYLCKLDKQPHKDIRRLVLIGCAQAQKPPFLKPLVFKTCHMEPLFRWRE